MDGVIIFRILYEETGRGGPYVYPVYYGGGGGKGDLGGGGNFSESVAVFSTFSSEESEKSLFVTLFLFFRSDAVAIRTMIAPITTNAHQ